MGLSDDDVKRVAKLAALELVEEDVPRVREQLNSIIEYVDGLSKLPTRGVVPTFNINNVTNVFRDDVIRPSFNEKDLALNAPEFAQGFFKVPQIIKTK